jgi:hypothetical protein
LVAGFKIPPKYSAHSADMRANVAPIGNAQNRTVRSAFVFRLGFGAACRGCG